MPRMIRTSVITVLVLLFAQPAETPRDELTRLRAEAHESRAAGDHSGYLQAALRLRHLLNSNPSAIESVARAYAEAGRTDEALEALADFANLGQVDDGLLDGSNKTFTSLAHSPQYKSILRRFVLNKAPVSRATIAFALSDPGLVAEDIDYDPESRSFLITSVLEKKVIRVSQTGAAVDFAQSPSGWPMLALKIDSVRRVVWGTEVAMDGFNAVPQPDWGRSAVLCFDLKGKLLFRVEGPHGSALGDMSLAKDGDLLISDGRGGGVYRLHDRRLNLVNGTYFISPQTPAPMPDGKHFLVPDYLRGVAILDLQSGNVQWMAQDVSPGTALNGVDGLYLRGRFLLATQNGTTPERVIAMRLDRSLAKVLSGAVVESGTPTLGDPTHGVFVGPDFYYIANSGWSELDDHGGVKPGSSLTSARIMRFEAK